MDLKFIINRLRLITLAEFVFRIKQKFRNIFEKYFLQLFHLNTNTIEPEKTILDIDFELIQTDSLLVIAERLCANKIDIFALKNFQLGEQIDYHRDYSSGLSAPSDKFGKSIDYRNRERLGDIKYIWEPNRHLFLIPLAIAYKVTGEQKYLDKFNYFLATWFDQNIFMYGVNWCSSLELAIRLINWTFCWHILANDIPETLNSRWMEAIYQHCWFINRNLSLHSSANNHLIGELAGLFIASTALPKFDRSSNWQKKSYMMLINECESQNYKDGVNKEQSVYYHHYVLDYLLISGLIGKVFNKDFPQTYWNRLEKMMEFISALEDHSGNIPHIGDDDDGIVIDLAQREYGIYRSLLNTGAYLFNRKDFLKKRNKNGMDVKSQFLLNIADIDYSILPAKEKAVPDCFPEGGYYILGTGFETKEEQKLVFDCGPLGYLSIAAHGHADALSFTLSAGGIPILIDPGTYSYFSDKRLRNYFRSTGSHNTLTVDGLDQSTMTGCFMWGQKAKAKILEYNDKIRVKGTHDGYMKLKNKVTHIREIKFNSIDNNWEIIDELFCTEEHNISLYFHCAPGCNVSQKGNEYIVMFEGGTCKIKNSSMIFSLYRGDDLPLGWYSPYYGVKEPINTIMMQRKIIGDTKIHTILEVRFK